MSKMPDFENLELLKQAMCHKSFLHENGLSLELSNERLEFLGDAILELWVRKELFLRYPTMTEGELSILKARIVSQSSLAELARSIDLGKYLIISKGEEKAGGREQDSLLANAFESLIGALYLDQDYQAVNAWLMNLMIPYIETVEKKKTLKDTKTILQEMVQTKFGLLPHYRLLSEKGQDHEKIFTIAVLIDGKQVSKGKGKNRKKAEMEAAEKAIRNVIDREKKTAQKAA